MFDPTTTGWLLLWSIGGYILVGMISGAVTSNAIYKDGGSLSDARVFGGVTIVLWPLALVILFFGSIWHLIISKMLTPKAHREKIKAEKAEREAKGIVTPGYVD